MDNTLLSGSNSNILNTAVSGEATSLPSSARLNVSKALIKSYISKMNILMIE